MFSMRNLSIRNKIIAINLSSCLLVLLVASIVFIGSTTFIYRWAVIGELESIAKIVGFNSRAALLFKDKHAASAILAALQSKPNITFAQITTKDGKIFAQYKIKQSSKTLLDEKEPVLPNRARSGPERLEKTFYHDAGFLGGLIHLHSPIRLDGKIIGRVSITSNLEALYSVIKANIAITFLATILSFMAAFFYSSRLQKIVSQPILQLLESMRIISTRQDYSVRAKRYGEDELGKLTDGFNNMLTHIQARDGELRIARKEAESASRAKSTFLANISHELRTPLNAIIGFSDILSVQAFGPLGSDRYREYAKDIHFSGEHLLSLINDILDISKIEAGLETLYEERVDVRNLIDSAVRLVKQRAQSTRVTIEIDLRGQLPSLYADERKMKQIFINLLANAIKFTPDNGSVTVRAWYRPEDGFVFQVADNGVGIAYHDIPKALEQFGQVDGAHNRDKEGTGLGLPLSKSLTELHGGSFVLESQLGKGTTVTLRLPADRVVRETNQNLGDKNMEKMPSQKALTIE